MTLYKKRFRVESARMPRWDYASPGHYFVTICTKSNLPFFGRIERGECRLTPAGNIVEHEWARTESIRPGLTLDACVIMPNHLHGIVVIEEDRENRPLGTIEDEGELESVPWRAGVLGSIIGQFKSICTKRIRREVTKQFSWQPGFYEHVIRNEEALNKIRQYIRGNPEKWEADRYYVA